MALTDALRTHVERHLRAAVEESPRGDEQRKHVVTSYAVRRRRPQPDLRVAPSLPPGVLCAFAIFSCSSSSSSAPNIPLVQLDECPFQSDAGEGALTTSSLRTSVGSCSQDYAICPIRAFAACPDGIGTEERLWICECIGQAWQCDIAGRKTWQCPPIEAGRAS